MKARFIIVLFITVFVNVYSQNNISSSNISIDINASSQQQALLQLSNQINYNFSYDSKLADSTKTVKLKLKNVSLSEVFYNILGDKYGSFQVIGNQIVITGNQELNINDNLEISKFIKGVLIDANTKDVVSFASVGILNKGIGTISNANGKFSLKIDSTLLNDSIFISSLGYNTYKLKISELIKSNHIIQLQPNVISIQEIIIRRINPEAIVKSAIEKIDDNYYQSPIHIEGFYREYVLKNNKLQSLNEAVVEKIQQPYHSVLSDQYKVLKALKANDKSIGDTVAVKIKGGLHAIASFNAIKNRPEFLDIEYLQYYNYQLQDIITYNDGEMYKIKITTTPDAYKLTSYKGYIYIDVKTLAFRHLDIEVLNSNSTSKTSISMTRKRGVKPRVKKIKFILQFEQYNNKYYLHNAYIELGIKVKVRKLMFNSNYKAVTQFVTTRTLNNDIKRFNKNETIRKNIVFSEYISDYPLEFWDNYNLVLPDDILIEQP